MVTVSVLILAKDERRCIARCLDSVIGHGFDIVVADTGSTDGTLDVVAGYQGVRVVRTPWSGSFADARNEALKHALGEWVVWLDADEWLADPAELVACLESITAKDVVLAPRISGAEIPRIFRADSGIRFRGEVHEYLVLDGKAPELVLVDVEFQHDGYDEAVFLAKDKTNRNLSLLAKARADEPLHPRWLYFTIRDGFLALPPERIVDLCETLRDLTGYGVGDRQSAAEYYRYALSLACQGFATLGNWPLVYRFGAELDRLEPRGHPDALYFRLVFELLNGVVAKQDLLQAVRIRKDEDLVSVSGVDRAGRHLDALIAALLDRVRGGADQYREMCEPWTDAFFDRSQLRCQLGDLG